MSGFETLASLLGGRLRWRGDKLGDDGLTCPVCGEAKLGIDYAAHHLSEHEWLVKVWCRSCRGDLGLHRLAEAVGMTAEEVVSGNETLGRRYRRNGKQPPPTMAEVETCHRALLASPPRLGYVTRRRGVSRAVIERFKIGHDGERYTLAVFDWDAPFEVAVNLRRYLPGGDPKMVSLAGSGAQLYTPIPDEPYVVVCEGEWDALRALSLGIPAVTQTGGALHWLDEYTERIGNRDAFVVYDRDNGGQLGEAKVRESFERVGLHRSLTIVRLPLPYRETHGPDLSDFLAKHSAARFKSLLRSAYVAPDARSPGRSRDSRRALPIATAKRRSEVGS